MAVGDECTLRIVGRYQDQNVVNTIHYRITGQGDSDLEILQKLCAEWENTFETGWLAAHSSAYELVGLKAFGKTGTGKTPGYAAVGTDGTVTGDGAPSFCCRTITLYTAATNHRKRGRLMLSGSPIAHFDPVDGSLTTAAIALLDTIGNLLDEELSDGVNSWRAGLPATGTDSWEDFTDWLSRETPSVVTSRRVRQFLIG